MKKNESKWFNKHFPVAGPSLTLFVKVQEKQIKITAEYLCQSSLYNLSLQDLHQNIMILSKYDYICFLQQ